MKKLAIITGANGGMGCVLTERLAIADFLVVMACRDLDEAEEIHGKLQKKTGKKILIKQLDLSSIDSILRFTNEIKANFTQLDILLNNAGVLLHQAALSKDGYEKTAAVNYLGAYLLTNELFPLFKKRSRIVNMASLSYKWYVLHKEFLSSENIAHFHRFRLYSNSKKALVNFTIEYAKLWKKYEISVFCADPGIVNTPIIATGNKWLDKIADAIFRPFIKTPEKGAATMIYLALQPDIEQKTGGYFINCKPVNPQKMKISEAEQAEIRTKTQQIIQNKLGKQYDYSS